MNNTDKEEIIINDINNKEFGKFIVRNKDPHFWIIEDNCIKLPIREGYSIVRSDENGMEDKRVIIAVTAEWNIVGSGLDLLAPIQIKKPKIDEPYIWFPNIDGKGETELRPGSQVIGGRCTGFYDDYGIILEAKHIGGDPVKFEDWAYCVLAESKLRTLEKEWILLDSINGVVSKPINITGFNINPNKQLDELLETGEVELYDYLIKNPNILEKISPKQFEKLVSSIYKNLGFITETIGAWNQADGGIDILAISKSFSGFEYRIAIQCKTSKNKITARPIRELAGVLDRYHVHEGIVVTTSKFTSSAIKEKEGHFWNISLEDKDRIIQRMANILIDNRKTPIWNL